MTVSSPSTTLHSFTPVRRRDSTINGLQFQCEDQEWTAARCHRLLRALTSRVAILQKDLANFSSAGQNERDGSRGGAAGKEAAKGAAGADWARGRNRIRQTYSKKNTSNKAGLQSSVQGPSKILSKGRKSLLPGEITVPTPILARARGELPAKDPIPATIPETESLKEPKKKTKRARMRGIANDESHLQLSEMLLELRKRINATRYATYEGIYSGLEALLRATAGNKTEPRRKGPSSLLAMSLRAVPRYIAQQEGLLRRHDEETGSKSAIETRDISSEMYNELESFGSSGKGWNHLRAIVRSHGIQVVSDAIRAGLLDVEFSGALIALCVNTSALEEAQILLSTLLNFSLYPKPKNPYDNPASPLTMLWKFTEHTGRPSFQYRQLSSMVASSVLPVEWLATKAFGPFWTGVVHSLSPEPDNTDTLIFLDISMAMLSKAEACISQEKGGAVAEAVRNTFSSILTLLSSVVILSRGAADSGSTKETNMTDDYQHTKNLLQSCLDQQPLGTGRQNPLVVLANLFVQNEDETTSSAHRTLVSTNLRQLIRSDRDPPAGSVVYASLVEFIGRVARCCGRGASTSGFEHLEHLHLIAESFADDTECGNLMQGLIVDSAFAFAQKLPDRRHLDYATLLEEKFSARRFGGESELLDSSTTDFDASSGFRWEEGIGEWVTATPAISKAKIVEACSTIDSENDTPLRPPPRLKREKASAATKETNSEPSSPSYYQAMDESTDMSELLLSTSSGSGDEMGEDLDIREAIRYDSSSERVIPSSPSGNSEFEDSSSHVSCRPYGSSPSITPESARSRFYHAPPRTPRLKRKLFSGTQDWNIFDESSVSFISSVPGSSRSSESQEAERNYVNKAPRLGRRALRSSQAWQVFNESDDELSFLSVSSEGDQALQDITNTSTSSDRLPRQGSPPQLRKKAVVKQSVSHNDSEDELCM